jgi:hypothetical protein
MTIVRVGSTGKYAEGWDKAFGKNRVKASVAKNKPAKKAASRKPAKKSTSRG